VIVIYSGREDSRRDKDQGEERGKERGEEREIILSWEEIQVQLVAVIFGGEEESATRQSGWWGEFSKEGDGWKEGESILYRPMHRASLRGDNIF